METNALHNQEDAGQKRQFFAFLSPRTYHLSPRSAFSTLELLIAFTIVIFTMAGVVMVSFGSQSLSVDALTNRQATSRGEEMLETARATSRSNFLSVVPIATTTPAGDIYSESMEMSDLTQCRKRVVAHMTWFASVLRTEHVDLTTDVGSSSIVFSLGGDCATDPPSGGFSHPNTLTSADIIPGGSGATGIDVINKIAYLSADPSSAADQDFFIFDATNAAPGNPPILLSGLDTGPGTISIDVVSSTMDGHYAYLGNNDDKNQLQVVDTTNLNSPYLVTSSTLPNMTGGMTCPGATNCPAARSIFFYKGRIYIGTEYLAFGGGVQNNEFHVYCVSDSSVPGCSPSMPIHMGSFNVNHNVNAIQVHDQMVGGVLKTIAYLATSADAGELVILDVTNPMAIASFTPFNLGGPGPGDLNATAEYLLGNTLYVGRERATGATNRDFYIINVSDPSLPSVLGVPIQLGIASNKQVTGIRVSGGLAFIVTTDSNIEGFMVLNISDPSNIVPPPPGPGGCPGVGCGKYNYPQGASGVDFENNFLYTSNLSNDALRIIRPAQCADKIDDDGDGKIDIADPQCHTDGNASNAASYNPEDDSEN